MSKPKRRRRWTADQKRKIVLETLQSDRQLAEICRREGISPTQVYQGRGQLLASAEAVFARKVTLQPFAMSPSGSGGSWPVVR